MEERWQKLIQVSFFLIKCFAFVPLMCNVNIIKHCIILSTNYLNLLTTNSGQNLCFLSVNITNGKAGVD